LNYNKQKQISNRYGEIYCKDLELLKFSKIKERIFKYKTETLKLIYKKPELNQNNEKLNNYTENSE
jgi:hypothetical protein